MVEGSDNVGMARDGLTVVAVVEANGAMINDCSVSARVIRAYKDPNNTPQPERRCNSTT